MSLQFCVLGSGSLGNAALVMTPDVHVLIDIGFLPDEMAARLDGTGAAWDTIDAVVLTHTHGDHVKKKCMLACVDHEIPFICHEHHATQLQGGRYFKKLKDRGLLRTYDGTGSFDVAPLGNAVIADGTKPAALRFQPIRVPHDCPPTFGFKIECRNGAAVPQKLAYLVDLGTCHDEVAHSVADVDLLALEFNHDEQLELRSGRHPRLIQRVLSDDGHLSNKQAAEVLRRVLERSGNGGPKVLVQMHLSQDCNRAELAYEAAQQVLLLNGAQTRVFSSRQDRRGTVHTL